MQKISCDEFINLIKPLLGLPISHPWLGYGSAIFLELGHCEHIRDSRLSHPMGEACIEVEWEWRVSDSEKILFGSSNSYPQIEKALPSLSRLTINEINLFGTPPELSVSFSNNNTLQSMTMVSGYPRWSIRIPDGTYIFLQDSSFIRVAGDEALGRLSEEEPEIINWTGETASRWGTPSMEQRLGDCVERKYFVQLDVGFSLLDYGVCTAVNSPFDGRAVKVSSGCPKYMSRRG